MKRSLPSPGVLAALTMVRASIWSSVFIVGAGAPGGVRLPWAKAVVRQVLKVESSAATISLRFKVVAFILWVVSFGISPSAIKIRACCIWCR